MTHTVSTKTCRLVARWWPSFTRAAHQSPTPGRRSFAESGLAEVWVDVVGQVAGAVRDPDRSDRWPFHVLGGFSEHIANEVGLGDTAPRRESAKGAVNVGLQVQRCLLHGIHGSTRPGADLSG